MDDKKPCYAFARGTCRYGNRCKYSHDVPATPRACIQFARMGRCDAADECKYSHDTKATDAEERHINGAQRDSSESQELLKRWRFSIPKEQKKARPLGDAGLSAFFKNGLKLVEEGTEYMQTVVTALASEHGLYRVRELLDRPWDEMDDSKLARMWQLLLSPYFTMLAHDTILQSTVVNVRYTTLLNDLYGAGGKQAVPIFRAAVRYLTAEAHESRSEFVVCIAVFASMLEKNDSAIVNPDLQAVAEAILALLDDTPLGRSTERHIRTIGKKLEIGSAIPAAGSLPVRTNPDVIIPTFTVAQDMPGSLSANGPRHDNDSPNIRDISILPTMEEIQSSRLEYLPREDPDEWHLPGMDGLIDRHFRLLREDTVGQLRDAAKFELERLQNPDTSAPSSKHQGARTFAYHNVVLENVVFDENKGLLFVLSFDQPAAVRGKQKLQREMWWQDSRRLQSDSLICFLSSRGQVAFLVVYSPSGASYQDNKKKKVKPIHELYTLANDENRARVIAQLTNPNPEDAVDFLKVLNHRSLTQVRLSLIEFPGVLLPTFGPTLSALQAMAETLDIPFSNFLVPDAVKERSLPPAYSQKTGFKFDLSALVPEQTDGEETPTEDVAAVLQRSALDAAQAEAIQHSMTNSLALIQGPPGTGKSYTGIKLIQMLLDNKETGELGPIVCVCYTNHALDQLLEHLVDAGVQQVIRIGSRSKSERLAAVNLREVSRREKFTRLENDERHKAKDSMSVTEKQINSLLVQLGDLLSQRDEAVAAYLKGQHPWIYAQLFVDLVDEDGFQEVRPRNAPSPLQAWLAGGHLAHHTAYRTFEDLLSENCTMHDLARGERENYFNDWVASICAEMYTELEVQLEAYNEDKATLDSTSGDKDLRTLSGANVIGVTTSGLARNLNYLRKLTSKVLVVEEAGEVLEAHLLTAMLPSLEHAILIGDHQQLRPKVQNYDLSTENPRSQIALDVSLFERLVQPRGENAQALPFVTLETQRRMHPSISTLIRETLYPNLQDAPSVQNYPGVAGMRHRLFWFNHDRKEDSHHEQLDSTSHTNSYEVEMVTALVRHLQRQGVYAASDIAVLTPYLGQLRKLRHKLSTFFDTILNDRDIDELAMDEEDSSNSQEIEDDGTRRPSVVKGTLLEALRLATVDNFQGEEAKVVIISLVRSNDQQKCGFLRMPNRINVLLSRAKHGMYIVGNAATSAHIPMWGDVMEILKDQGSMGDTLELSCPRHPETPLQVTEPEHFSHVAPEAGCDLMCGMQLACGHACPTKCHAESLHNSVYCHKDCNRPKKGCQHVCKLDCGADCNPQCDELVECDIELACGHRITSLPCWQYQSRLNLSCNVPVMRTVPGCGHSVTEECYVNVEGMFYRCREACLAILPDCSHLCQDECCKCRSKDSSGDITRTEHAACQKICGKKFTTCGHSCESACHEGDECPPCKRPCSVSCIHSKCAKPCSEPCAPCTEEKCPSHCPHSACEMPCGAPCNWVPCSKRCEEKLGCGHRCPGLCGEQCPDEKFCQDCAVAEIRDSQVDLIMGVTYGDIDLDENPCMFLPCGHIFTFESLDGQMAMNTHYDMEESKGLQVPVSAKKDLQPLSQELLKTCPLCRGSLRSVHRYGRVVRRTLLDESTKKFITWSNAMCFDLASQLQTQQAALIETRAQAKLSGNIKIDGKGTFSFPFRVVQGVRFRDIMKLRRDILAFQGRVRKDEQPFQKVHDLVEAVRRRQRDAAENADTISSFDYDEETILQTRGHLLASALLIRCELIAITDLICIWEALPAKERSRTSIAVNTENSRQRCDELVKDAEKSLNVLQRAEGNIFWAHFVALECTAMYGHAEDEDTSQRLKDLRELALERLDRAQDICDEFPGSTVSVADEVAGVREMLTESISASELRMVVAAMSTEFSGTGHWYRCINGHLFTIGECGQPMESTRCIQCGARIGGESHQAANGVTYADDVEN